MIGGGNVQVDDLGKGSKVWRIELPAQQEGAARLGEFILLAEEKAHGEGKLSIFGVLSRQTAHDVQSILRASNLAVAVGHQEACMEDIRALQENAHEIDHLGAAVLAQQDVSLKERSLKAGPVQAV